MKKNMLAEAIALAADKFRDKVDLAGEPYILHCLRVMNAMPFESTKIIAVLHDIVEDTDITYQDLEEMGYSDDIVDAVRYLTRHEGVEYDSYIGNMEDQYEALLVKRADLKDNMDLTRVKLFTMREIDRLLKYHKAYMNVQRMLDEITSS